MHWLRFDLQLMVWRHWRLVLATEMLVGLVRTAALLMVVDVRLHHCRRRHLRQRYLDPTRRRCRHLHWLQPRGRPIEHLTTSVRVPRLYPSSLACGGGQTATLAGRRSYCCCRDGCEHQLGLMLGLGARPPLPLPMQDPEGWLPLPMPEAPFLAAAAFASPISFAGLAPRA